MKIKKSRLQEIIAEEVMLHEKEKNNPWAICTSSVGRDDKDKYESCVQGVKKEKNVDEVLKEIAELSEEDTYDSLQREKEAFKNVVSSVLGPKLVSSIDKITMDRILTAMAFSYQLGKKRGKEEPEREGMPNVGENQ